MLKLGIIGHPLGHTLSPLLHQTLMNRLGLNGDYAVYDTPPERLGEKLTVLEAEGLRGLNVTIPHKVAVIEHLDGLSEEALLIGAVNTVVFDPAAGRMGFNTDATGFLAGLDPGLRSRLPQTQSVILGGGGAGRAVLTALIQENTREVMLAVRSPEKGKDLLTLAEQARQHYTAQTTVSCVALNNLPALAETTLLINTTPVGMAPHTDQSPIEAARLDELPAGAWVYDLIYRPRQTRLLQQAQTRGLKTQDGLAMLVHQGLESFARWTHLPQLDNKREVLAEVLNETLSEALQSVI